MLAFINSFAGRLTSDPTLQAAYNSTLQEFAAVFSFTSPGQFVQITVFALLDL